MARKIKIGLTFDLFLNDIRELIVSIESINCIHIVKKQNLYNIVRDYKFDRNSVDRTNKKQIYMNERNYYLSHRKL